MDEKQNPPAAKDAKAAEKKPEPAGGVQGRFIMHDGEWIVKIGLDGSFQINPHTKLKGDDLVARATAILSAHLREVVKGGAA